MASGSIDQVMTDIDRAHPSMGLAVAMPFGQVGQQIIDRSENHRHRGQTTRPGAGYDNRTATENPSPAAVVEAVIVPRREGPSPRAAGWP